MSRSAASRRRPAATRLRSRQGLGATIDHDRRGRGARGRGHRRGDDLLEPARALRAHPRGGRRRQGRVHREADGHPPRRLPRAAAAAWTDATSAGHARAQPPLLPSGRAAPRQSIELAGRLRRVRDRPAVPAAGPLDAGPGGRRRPADHRGRALHRPVQPAHRQDARSRSTARALGQVPDDLRTLCNFAVTLHYERAAANVVFDESGSAEFPTGSD